MQSLPHVYRVRAGAGATDGVSLAGAGLPVLETDAPPEFGGPPGRWSPEALLCASVASCFILTFRAIARASKLPWRQLDCSVEGTLDRLDGAMQFTHVSTRVTLELPEEADHAVAQRLLVKAEHDCLITNSLKCPRQLTIEVRGSALPRTSASGGAP